MKLFLKFDSYKHQKKTKNPHPLIGELSTYLQQIWPIIEEYIQIGIEYACFGNEMLLQVTNFL